METARPDSWKTTPMPKDVVSLDYSAAFSREEFEKISCGFIPKTMEDKWFIFLEDRILSLHRSWSGHCIYQVEFGCDGPNYSVRRAVVNRAPEEYRQTDDDYDSQLLRFLVNNLLLGKKEPLPVPSQLPPKVPKGVYQHHVAGCVCPEKRIAKRPWWKFW